MSDLLMTRRVVFSECGLYRYLLEHDFGGPGPVISLGMVNPSLADGKKNDPTMTKVDGFATRLGASKVKVWNPFALIAKDVRDLRDAIDPIGPENDAHIAQAIRDADIHIVAWGPLSKLPKPLRGRWRSVVDVLLQAGAKPMCWGTALDGQPRHPLMLAYATPLVPWSAPPCAYCKGHGWNWQLPNGVNAFAIGANGIAKISRKITCHCCLGAGTVPLPASLPIQKERTE